MEYIAESVRLHLSQRLQTTPRSTVRSFTHACLSDGSCQRSRHRSSRGIGRATALLAGARGWNVGIHYVRNAAAAEANVEEVNKAGGQAIALHGDMSQEVDVIILFDSMQDAYGTTHGVVINAGITAPAMPLAGMSVERLRHIFNANISGGYLCVRELIECHNPSLQLARVLPSFPQQHQN